MGWSREHKIGFALVCGMGALLGLFVGFTVFSIAVGRGTAAAFSFWIQRPSLYWPWPTFGAAIAGLGFYAMWMLRRPREPSREARQPHEPSHSARVDAYHSLIAKAISQLPVNDPASRRGVYDRARSALAGHSSKETFRHEQRALDAAIGRIERQALAEMTDTRNEPARPKRSSTLEYLKDRDKPKYENLLHRPSTGGLVFSLLWPGFWLMDVTCMSLYWVARIPRPPNRK
jgi:hypothetical protein